MNKGYWGVWLIITLTLIIITTVSFIDHAGIDVGIKTAPIAQRLTDSSYSIATIAPAAQRSDNSVAPTTSTPLPVDTTAKTILLLGDSMIEGLSPRLAAYAHHNGHSLYSVIWYGSTTSIWARSGKIAEYIKQFNPDYIFISLGGNEMFVKDIRSKRRSDVMTILSQIGSTPMVWIGPPNWKGDTGINALIAECAGEGRFFLSKGMDFERAADRIHPTPESAALWMDSIANWIPHNAAAPIRLDNPGQGIGKADRVITLQPVK